MRRTLVAALFAGLAAVAFATPASALPSSTTTQLADTNAGVNHVGRRDRAWRDRHYDRGYRGYSYYRPYNRYYRPYPYYYRPYAYGGYPYGYGGYGYRRPGISFGFSF